MGHRPRQRSSMSPISSAAPDERYQRFRGAGQVLFLGASALFPRLERMVADLVRDHRSDPSAHRFPSDDDVRRRAHDSAIAFMKGESIGVPAPCARRRRGVEAEPVLRRGSTSVVRDPEALFAPRGRRCLRRSRPRQCTVDHRPRRRPSRPRPRRRSSPSRSCTLHPKRR